ncbi:MAG: glycosyltransferase family 9 protein [bacterium]|nr:glycosyltransferase family 9 protein [bacterium]
MNDLLSLKTREEILIIQPIVGIGDMIWHVPWIRAIAKRHNVTLCCKPTSQARKLLKDISGITNFIDLKRSMRGEKGVHDGFLGILKLSQEFKKHNFTRCIILHSSWRYALSAKLARISRISGYGKGLQKLWINDGNSLSKEDHKKHFIEKVRLFFDHNGMKVQENFLLPVSNEAKKAAQAYIPKDPYIVLGVNATEPLRRWPPDYFASFLNLLSKCVNPPKVLLVGTPSDQDQINALMLAIQNTK